jgi:hypothetical protein
MYLERFMGYESVDKLQKLLAAEVFHYANDKKKAAGRALGTFVELITYYIIKNWQMEVFTAIERPLPEFANSDITHNVEFTLHGSRHVVSSTFKQNDLPISSNTLKKKHAEINDDVLLKSNMLIDKNNTIRNACVLFSKNDTFVSAYVDSVHSTYEILELQNKPFAMFECKRVGVEEGMKKGPQTIEKAKQGSYVARTVSALQRIRYSDGSPGGIIQKADGTFLIKDYYSLLQEIINSNDTHVLNNFILTVGVISNHGNWFTAENQNKELKVLAQSYDWLVFLTDNGIGEFITDLLIQPKKQNKAIKEAFDKSYSENKNGNVFTKVKINYDADIALMNYFKTNKKKIESWFNIIAPKDKTISDLENELILLSKKDWWEVYR